MTSAILKEAIVGKLSKIASEESSACIPQGHGYMFVLSPHLAKQNLHPMNHIEGGPVVRA